MDWIEIETRLFHEQMDYYQKAQQVYEDSRKAKGLEAEEKLMHEALRLRRIRDLLCDERMRILDLRLKIEILEQTGTEWGDEHTRILASTIREYRKKNNVSLSDLESKSGVGWEIIGDLENGKISHNEAFNIPSFDNVKKLLDAMGVAWNDVFKQVTKP